MGFKTALRTVSIWALASAFGVSFGGRAQAQSRLSDNDVASLMGNLKDDAKSFRPKFNDAVHKSSIRKTSREKDAKNLAERFQKETEGMLNAFKKNKKADNELAVVRSTAGQIDQLMTSLQISGQASQLWSKIQTELRQVEGAFGNQSSASFAQVSSISEGPSCTQSVGRDHADHLVEQCLKVSTSTHSVCSAQNSCKLIIDEIKRGCRGLGQDAPMFCNEYAN